MDTIRFFCRLFMLVGLVEQAASCDQHECAFDRVMIPTHARGVDQTCMGEAKAAQVDFTVKVPYRDESVLDYYKAHYISNGWSQCSSETGWQKFQKQTGELQELEMRLAYFANRPQEELLMVSLMHPLREYHDGSWRQSASKEAQQVRVVLYDLPENTFNKHISELGIKCE